VSADAEPNGRSAVAVQCLWAKCGLVRIDLESGTITSIVAGTVGVTFNHPRVSPDGRWIAVAAQREGRWRTELHAIGGNDMRVVGPADNVERYDASFTPDGAALVLVSEAGNVPNLERIDISSNTAYALTRVTGAAIAPEPATDGNVYFLRLHAKGLDIARVRADSSAGAIVTLDAELTPVAPLARVTAPDFPAKPTEAPHAYGIGDRQYRWNPVLGFGRGGLIGGAYVLSTDPVGRLSWLLQTRFGGSEWSGGSLRVAVRRFTPVTFEADVFGARQELPHSDAAPFATADLDADFKGAWTALAVSTNRAASGARLRAGVSVSTLKAEGDETVQRRLAAGGSAAACRCICKHAESRG
jgi:hypothetical protein